MKRGINLTLSIAVLAFTACSTGTNKETTEHASNADTAHTATTATVLPAEFEDPKTAAVYESYVKLTDAFVKTNGTEAQTAAAALQTALTDAGNSKGADLAGKIASVSDVKVQRAELESLTAEVESVVKSAKIKSGVIYKQYCPMANDNNGGYWLSSQSDIRNPYFGDEMLECGSTKEEIK